MEISRIVAEDVLKNGISLFFPAYNEEKNVGSTIECALAILPTFGCDYEVVIVDDGSKDKTAEIVDSYRLKNEHVALVKHPCNQGYGRALQTGFKNCRYGLIFFSDCDQQFDLNELPLFIERMRARPEVAAVIGYRIKRADPLIRKLNAWGWKVWARLLFGLQVKDVDCAFKLFKREVIRNITIESSGALISVELLTKIQNMGYSIAEVGVHHYPRPAGVQTGAKFRVIMRAFYESFKLFASIKRFRKGPES